MTTRFLHCTASALLLLIGAVAAAQAPAPAAAPRADGTAQAPAPQASMPRAGMGPGMGMGPGRGAGMRGGRAGQAGAGFTPGWTLMTPAERDQHRAQMAAAKSHEECVATMAQQREQMAARAKERGVPVPTPRRDACAAMKP